MKDEVIACGSDVVGHHVEKGCVPVRGGCSFKGVTSFMVT